jgi:ATP-dependent Clp protease ATP-binding subunit ClpC
METNEPVEPSHQTPFTSEFRELLRDSRLLALQLGNGFITSNHFLMLILQGENDRVQASMQALGVPVEEVRKQIIESCRARGVGQEIEIENVPLTIEAEGVVKQAVAEYVRRQGGAVGTEHLLLAMAHNTESDACKALGPFGFSYDAVVHAMGI